MSPSRTVALFALMMALWLLWSGHYEPLTVGFGVVSSVLTVWLAQRMKVVDEEGYPLHMTTGLLFRYLPWLVVQIMKSNVQVAWLILQPSLPIRPRVVRILASQRTTIGQVIHANSITVTPGTISLDLRDDQIMVHALTADAAAEDSTGEMDRRVTALERAA